MTKATACHLEGKSPEDFKLATKYMAHMGRLAEHCEKHAAQRVAAGVLSHEIAETRKDAENMRAWLAEFVCSLPEASK